MSEKVIKIKYPKNFMNCAISADNIFIADTNYTKQWDTLRFPLPTPQYKWSIFSNDLRKGIITLVDGFDELRKTKPISWIENLVNSYDEYGRRKKVPEDEEQ